MPENNARSTLDYLVNIDLKKYFYENTLSNIIGSKDFVYPKNPVPNSTFNQEGGAPFEPECPDLTRLYAIVRERKALTVLELGSGKSTRVIAKALQENENDYSEKISLVRREKPFHLYSIESEKNYAEVVNADCKKFGLEKFITLNFIGAEQTIFNGRVCGQYKYLPSICPDFIYIDGPSPYSYKNSGQQYIDISHPDITNITCDLLRIEHLLLPGTIVLFDGLTNNARFNRTHLLRNWICHEDTVADFTILILDEEPLGIHHKNQIKFQNNK